MGKFHLPGNIWRHPKPLFRFSDWSWKIGIRKWCSASCNTQQKSNQGYPVPSVNSGSSKIQMPADSWLLLSSCWAPQMHRKLEKSFFTRYSESSRQKNSIMKQLPLNETGLQPWSEALKRIWGSKYSLPELLDWMGNYNSDPGPHPTAVTADSPLWPSLPQSWGPRRMGDCMNRKVDISMTLAICSLRGNMKSLLIMLWHQTVRGVLTEILCLSRHQLNIKDFSSIVPICSWGRPHRLSVQCWRIFDHSVNPKTVNKINLRWGGRSNKLTRIRHWVWRSQEDRYRDTQEGIGRDLEFLSTFGLGCWRDDLFLGLQPKRKIN